MLRIRILINVVFVLLTVCAFAQKKDTILTEGFPIYQIAFNEYEVDTIRKVTSKEALEILNNMLLENMNLYDEIVETIRQFDELLLKVDFRINYFTKRIQEIQGIWHPYNRPPRDTIKKE